MAQAISLVVLGSPAHAIDARAGEVRITIVADPWGAPFTAAELASALRLRLPRAEVMVAQAGSPSERSGDGERSERSVTVKSLSRPSALRVERGSGDATEFPLTGGGRARTEPAQLTRRAALFIALFADAGAPLGEVVPPAHEAAAGEPERGATSPRALAAPTMATPAVSSPSRDGMAPPGWALGAQLGVAFATGDSGVSPAEALTVQARRYLSSGTAVELGARLSGEFDARLATQAIGVADRSFFAGIVYEARLAPRIAVDLGAALQYTLPLIDIDDGPVKHLDAPAGTRLAVRTSVGLVWSPVAHLTVGISAATAFSFREREYVDEAGREVVDLGSMILDVTAGAGARW